MRVRYANRIHRIPQIIGSSIFLLFALVFLLISFKIMKQEIPEDYVETEATIEKIIETKIREYGETRYEYEVYIGYSYDGKDYTNVKYDKYSSSMDEGEKVLIYVNQANPVEFMSDPSDNYLFAVISGVFVIIGAVGLIYNIRKLKLEREGIE